jgi:methionine-rich copper-binding protein CopC
MSLTINDIRDAGFLANAAYDVGANASSNLVGSSWQYVNPAAFGVSNSFIDPHGFFSVSIPQLHIDAQALLAFNSSTNTLAIAFRGTDSLDDLVDDMVGGAIDFGAVYLAFSAFVASVLSQANTFGASRILVTGHSLGGAMAEEAMAHNISDNRLSGVTFGSPGVQDISNSPSSDSRLLNIGHVDLFTSVGTNPFFTGQGDAVFRATIGEHVQGSDIRVDLQDEQDYTLTTTGLRAAAQLDYGQHEPYRYSYTAQAIASELTKNLNDGHPFDVRAFSYVIGTDSAKSTLTGSSGSNVIIGDSGSDIISGYDGIDILDGGGGDDQLVGGGGNDIIYGGSGTDTAVYSLDRSQYGISIRGNNIIVTAKGPLAYEGTDTVNNDVEKFQFYDGTFTLAQLLAQSIPSPDTTAPTLTNKSPADNSTAVVIASSIGLTFSESVFKGSGNIDIHKSDGSLFERIAITDTTQVTFSGSSVTINPSFDLAPGTSYYINIDAGAILDQSGNSFAGISNQPDFNFTTAAAADTSAPVLSATSPADNAGAVALGANIGLTFNEIVVPGSSGTIDIHNSNGSIFKSTSILDASQVTFNNNVVTINPNADLVAGSDYYVTIGSGAIHDVAGNSFSGISSNTAFNFTTASAPNLPPAHDTSIFLSIVDNSITEGNSGTKTLSFGVNLTGAGAGTQTVSVQYTTQDIAGAGSPATAGQDYIAASGVLVIPAGQTFGQADVKVFGDSFQETDEVFRLVLTQPSSNLTLLNNSGQVSSSIFATGFIDNDDQAPNHIPTGAYDLAITAPNTPITIDVLANDTDLDGDSLHIASGGGLDPFGDLGHGTVSIANNKILFTPASNFTGVFGYTYVLDDGHGGLRNVFSQVIVAGDGSPGVTNPGTIDNDIVTGTRGNDTLLGGFGDDIIAGGPGADRIDGGAGFDYLDLRQAAHGASIQFRDPWIFNDGDGGQDILTNIEGVLGSRFDDQIDGSSANIQYITTGYRFYGGDGNDRLQSDAGDDLLDGGAGNDILIFGSGHDVVFGGAGNDQIYSFTGFADMLSDTLDGGPGDDMIYSDTGHSPDVVTAGDGKDYIQFSDGDIVSGGTGADTFFLDGLSPGTVYHATITDLEPGDTIKWQFQNIVVINNVGYHFIGPITNGNGTSTALDRVEFASANGQTTFYFGFDANPGADFVLSINGAFDLSQFQVDDSDFTLAMHVLARHAIPHDFDANFHSDILWHNDNGATSIWDNGAIGGAHIIADPGLVPATWHIAGKGDFDGNGQSDILWRNDIGAASIWDGGQIGNAHIISAAGVVPNSWHVSGTGDFDGNHNADILWRNDNGAVSIWDNGQIGGAHIIAAAGVVPKSWHIAGTGDFDGNGHSDILWRNDNGAASIWDNGQIGGAHIIAAAGIIPSGWNIAGTGDFDGNGHDDILWRNDNGAVSIWDDGQIGGAHIVSAAGVVPNSWHISDTGDYDGNGRSDILWRNDNGAVSIWDDGAIAGAHIIAAAGIVSNSWHIV